jgi:subtilisin-like proprotein convertase family protein
MYTILNSFRLERSFISQLLIIAFLFFASTATASAQATFTNPAPITIADSNAPPTPANPYPSGIIVRGLASGAITKVTVSLKGFSHAFPDDVDIILVSPNGVSFVLFSDLGGTTGVNNLHMTLDDEAKSVLPDAGPLVSGTFRPSNVGIADTFPGTGVSHPADDAEPGGTATFASKFNGLNSDEINGTWKLYVVDDTFSDAGSISDGWSITFSGVAAGTAPLIISEFRLRGPNGAIDEFVEIYNNSDTATYVLATDGSAGFALAASDGAIRFIIPNGTIIPARGHYLGTNFAYSLDDYAFGDSTYGVDIGSNAGIALFNTDNPTNFTFENRLDAVGSTSETNFLYKEGNGYSPVFLAFINYSFVRKENVGTCSASVIDTNNNSEDFLFVDTNGNSGGAGQRLGAPGPQNFASPVRPNSTMLQGFAESRVDAGVPFGDSPNTLRDTESDPDNNATFGKLVIRRKFTNNTGSPIRRLRFRVTNITTLPASSGTADLRPMSSSKIGALPISGGRTVAINGTTLEQPPSQPIGGGFNSTLSVNSVTPFTPLASGASLNVQFVFGIEQIGAFNIALNIESLPVGDKNQAFVYSGIIKSLTKPNPAAITSFNQPCTLPVTAATVAVAGHALTSPGRGISNVLITMIDGAGNVRTTMTGAFGYYRFEDVAAGETYIISARAKRFTFVQPSLLLNVQDETNDVNFIGEGNSKR